jgi:hypothetical protein
MEIPVQDSTSGRTESSNNLKADNVSSIIPMSMTLPLLQEASITHKVNMAVMGSKSTVKAFDQDMSPFSNKNTSHTQLDPCADKAILIKQTESIADIGILTFNAFHAPYGNLLSTIM